MVARIVLVFVVSTLCTCALSAFNCPSLPSHVPANVTDLRPGNIKVVMAMGDSITAGFGINGAKGELNEYRGWSCSIGGASNATTLANFLKFYSPNIQGASLGYHLVELCGNICPPDQYRPVDDVLNSAQSGALVSNLVTHELDYLIRTLKGNPAINMNEDWKLLTILIGANDLCASCENNTFLDPNEYENHLIATLEGVRTNIPRVFVQILEIFNLSQVYNLSLKTKYCTDIHRDLSIECPCVFRADANQTRQQVDIYTQLYNARSRAVAAKYQALRDPQFTVVAQPFGRNTDVANLPIELLSTLDCFHPSLLAHEAMAIAMWNNMLTPAAYKKTALNLTDTPLCPTPDTLLYTF